MERRKLAQMGLRMAEQMDLPGELTPGVPDMQLVGSRQFFMMQHKGVLAYSPEAVEIDGGTLLVRLTGRELQLQAMTETEIRRASLSTRTEPISTAALTEYILT